MSYQLHIRRSAEAYLTRLDRPTNQRITQRLAEIAQDPYGPETKALAGPSGLRSSRVGRWRIIFEVDEGAWMVNVTRIGPRGQVYRGL